METLRDIPSAAEQDLDEKPAENLVDFRRLAWIPIAILAVVIAFSWSHNLHAHSPHLFLALNVIFIMPTAIVIAIIFGRRFLVSGAPGFLLFGCGDLVFGMANTIPLMIALTAKPEFDPNVSISIHNISMWLSSLFCLAGTTPLWTQILPDKGRRFTLAGAYVFTVGLVGLVVLAVLYRVTPIFFVGGLGGTEVRNFMLGSTFVMYLMAARMLWTSKLWAASPFLQWSSLCFLLVGLSSLELMLESLFFGTFLWISQLTIYVAAVYMFLAVLSVHRLGDDQIHALVQPREKPKAPYAFATVIVLIAAVIRLVFMDALKLQGPFMTFGPGVLFAAVYGGFRAGLFATVLSIVIAEYFWLVPGGSSAIEAQSDYVAILIFFIVGMVLSWFAVQLNAASARARTAEALQREDLERLVAERTAKLTSEIVARRQAETALKTALDEANLHKIKLETILEVAPVGVCIARDPECTEIFGNQASHTLFHIPPSHSLVKAYMQAFRAVDNELKDIPLELLPVQRAARGERVVNCEFNIIFPDGSRRHCYSNAEPLRNSKGAITGSVATFLDITHLKETEQALRDSEERAHLVERTLTQGIIHRDSAGKVISLNAAAEAILGRVAENFESIFDKEHPLLGADGSILTPADLPSRRAIQSGEIVPNVVVRVYNPKKKMYRWVSIDSVPLFRHGDQKPYETYAIFSDITESVEATKALADAKARADRANLSKSKFLASASHDLRQPVQSLALLTSAMELHINNRTKATKTLDMMKAAVDGLTSLLTGILDLSSLDAGLVVPVREKVDVGEMVEHLTREYTPAATNRGLKLRSTPAPLWTWTDQHLLERIVRNLIENALRYTKTGSILISVGKRGEKLGIDVIDTGVGIPADKQSEIFEEFYQVDNPARESDRGMGLGLAIVSRLAKLLDADVEVDSTVGKGSRFSIILPLDVSEPASERKEPEQSEDAGGRILVIEDNATLRQGFELTLETWGYETLAAATGEEALEIAAQANWEFDGIITDQRLGSGLSGTASAKEISIRANKSFPTIVLTGDTAVDHITEIHSSGFIVLHKPIRVEDLRSNLAQMLKAWH